MKNKTYILTVRPSKLVYWVHIEFSRVISTSYLGTINNAILFGATESVAESNIFSKNIYGPYLIYLRKMYNK